MKLREGTMYIVLHHPLQDVVPMQHHREAGCCPDAASPRGCVQIRVTSHYYTSMVPTDVKDKYDLANRLKQYTKYKVKIYLATKVYFCFECHLQTSKQGYT